MKSALLEDKCTTQWKIICGVSTYTGVVICWFNMGEGGATGPLPPIPIPLQELKIFHKQMKDQHTCVGNPEQSISVFSLLCIELC